MNPHSAVCKRVGIERPSKLAVDSDEKISIERSSHAERIVVRQHQIPLRLHEIRTEQQHVAGCQTGANTPQECASAGSIEVADVGSQEEHQLAAAGGFGGR